MLEQRQIDPSLIDELIADLAAPEGFPEEAVRSAMAERDLACAASRVILLRAGLAVANEEPDELEGASLFALVLLGYHKDEDSAEMVRGLLGLPAAVREAMLGDGFGEYMGPVLWAVSGGDASPLIALVREGDLDPFALAQVIRAILIGVLEGQVDRLCILPVLADRLSRVLAVPDDLIEEDDAWFADIFAQAIVDLSVEGEDEEYLVGVEQVVERGMFTEYSSVPYWPENLALTRDEVIVGLSSREGHRYPPDPMDLASWAAFKEPGPTPLNLEDIRRTANAEEKSKAKAKRKAARKARKKSRSKGR